MFQKLAASGRCIPEVHSNVITSQSVYLQGT